MAPRFAAPYSHTSIHTAIQLLRGGVTFPYRPDMDEELENGVVVSGGMGLRRREVVSFFFFFLLTTVISSLSPYPVTPSSTAPRPAWMDGRVSSRVNVYGCMDGWMEQVTESIPFCTVQKVWEP